MKKLFSVDAAQSRSSNQLVVSEKVSIDFRTNGDPMTYSGADVLAHLSELARQRALTRPVADAILVAPQPQDGEFLQSALRSVLGYNTRISIAAMITDAAKMARDKQPDVVFALDPSKLEAAGVKTLQSLRTAGIRCPIGIISNYVSPKSASEIMQAGAFDVIHRDDVCGIRLRQCLLKLAAL
jgi:CheY-like chemotaxis protein